MTCQLTSARSPVCPPTTQLCQLQQRPTIVFTFLRESRPSITTPHPISTRFYMQCVVRSFRALIMVSLAVLDTRANACCFSLTEARGDPLLSISQFTWLVHFMFCPYLMPHCNAWEMYSFDRNIKLVNHNDVKTISLGNIDWSQQFINGCLHQSCIRGIYIYIYHCETTCVDLSVLK